MQRDMLVDALEQRLQFSITAVFTASIGQLNVIGDAQNNTIVVSRNAAGALLVNGGAVPIIGGAPTVATVRQVNLFGLDGNDTLRLDETNGALPKALIFGGSGNDTITGGSGADLLFGQAGNDQLLGKGGVDLLFGGAGDDVLTGGVGDDKAFGEAGNDRMIWNPGEGTDVNEGGAGTDTVEVNGANVAERYTVAANGARVRLDRLDPGPFSIDIGTSETLVLNANGGDDTVTAGNGLATLIRLVVDGGAGNDSITGGDGADTLLGGDGNDTVNGGRGNDRALLGAGDDTFIWNPGEGSDVVEGQAGRDTMLFNGANIDEVVNIASNGGRIRFTRDVGGIVMDTDDVEHVVFNALAGVDKITVGNLAGTDLTDVDLDLGAGDGQPDDVIVTGTAGDDVVRVAGDASGVTVSGLFSLVRVTGAQAANDRLTVNAGAGDDVVEASGLAANAIRFAADGGDGNDILTGGDGNDTFLGGAGDDVLTGGPGVDLLDGGAGNNTVIQ